MALSYMINGDLCFLCICDRSYPRKLAFTYLSDLASEFTQTYQPHEYLNPGLRPYAFVQFDTFIQRTKKTYQDTRATQNLDRKYKKAAVRINWELLLKQVRRVLAHMPLVAKSRC
jgi:hypothetical protein